MRYYLSLGANLGERERTIRQAVEAIEQQIGRVLRCSSFYYSEPWGFESENEFCNLCCAVESSLSPLEVLHSTQSIERTLGRKEKTAISNEALTGPTTNDKRPTTNYTDRCIDIDIIRVFDGQEEVFVDMPELTIPHRFWEQRDFVKVPLAEIMQ